MRGFSVATCILVLGAFAAVPISAQAAGSISGVVTAAGGGAPQTGVQVCASRAGASEEFGCTETQSDGSYSLGGLSADSYKIHFWPELTSEYVAEYYDGKPTWSQATPVAVADGGNTSGIHADLDLGGAVSGRIVDVVTQAGLAKISACALLEGKLDFFRCSDTESDGDYAIHGLRPGAYEVFFSDPREEGAGEYVSQAYGDDNPFWVDVTSGVTSEGVNAALIKGGSIAGTVTDAVSGAGVRRVLICARESVSGELQDCTSTNGGGQYLLSGLASGGYKIWFSPDLFAQEEDDYFSQYFSGASTFAAAITIPISPGSVVTGIDGRLVSKKAVTASTAPSSPPAMSPVPAPGTAAKPAPKRCPKGKRLVNRKGKPRCVRKHRRTDRRHRAQRGRHRQLRQVLLAARVR